MDEEHDAGERGRAGAPSAPRRITLRLHIATIFVLLVAVAGLAIIGQSYLATSRLLLSASEETFGHVAARTADQLRELVAPARLLIDLLAHHRLATAGSLRLRMESVPFLAAALAEEPALSAIYLGYPDGAFLLIRPLRTDEDRRRVAAPPGSAYLVQSMAPGEGPVPGRFLYLDGRLTVLGDEPRPTYQFDPRTREWYRQAMDTAGRIRTDPYLFFTTREPGTTIARQSPGGASVAGVDLTLRQLSRSLREHRLTPSARIALVDGAGRVVAHPDAERLVKTEGGDRVRLARLEELGDPVLAQTFARSTPGTRRVTVTAEGREWIGVTRPTEADGGRALTLLLAAPRDELLAEARGLVRRQVLAGFLVLVLATPVVWLLARRISRPLEALAGEARAIRGFEFADRPRAASRIVEVDDLGEAMAGMRSTIRQFLETSAALAAEDRLDRLLERVIEDTVRTAGAREGALYLADETTGALTRAVHRPAGPQADLDGATFPPALDPAAPHPCSRAATGRLAVIEPTVAPVAVTTLAIPLVNRAHDLVGVLGLRLDGDLSSGSGGERNPRLAFAEALSSVAAVAIETRHLIQAQKALLDAFIQVVAAAIDAKSPYTGGHCQRVPTLARMLAEAAVAETDGPFRTFALAAEEWEVLHIASWLHDCGKVTTPEFVVDKAVKLETIYNRLHEVRMRFEVLKRDADVAYWRAVAGGADEPTQRATRDHLQRTLDEEFAFVAKANVGGEVMSPEHIARLRAIATRTWVRTLDDRLGLAEEERRRRAAAPAPPLPVTEPVLADRPEHLVPRTPAERLPADNPWGFRLEVPAHKLNLGEVYSLSIGRGTLTEEERYIINHHVVQTTLMLARLPFPKHLRRVPAVAGGHHERVDGRGYPRRLTGAETDVLARIVAIADVFEALTASDRPYKKAKTLSDSLGIMRDMARSGHIDPDLFRLFVRGGVYRRYAASYLAPAQMDAVDETALLGD